MELNRRGCARLVFAFLCVRIVNNVRVSGCPLGALTSFCSPALQEPQYFSCSNCPWKGFGGIEECRQHHAVCEKSPWKTINVLNFLLANKEKETQRLSDEIKARCCKKASNQQETMELEWTKEQLRHQTAKTNEMEKQMFLNLAEVYDLRKHLKTMCAKFVEMKNDVEEGRDCIIAMESIRREEIESFECELKAIRDAKHEAEKATAVIERMYKAKVKEYKNLEESKRKMSQDMFLLKGELESERKKSRKE